MFLLLAPSSILLYGVSMTSFGLIIFEATARPRRCAALPASNGAALGVLPSCVAPSCMIFTVSLPLELVCLGAWDAFFSCPSLPRSAAPCHPQHNSVTAASVPIEHLRSWLHTCAISRPVRFRAAKRSALLEALHVQLRIAASGCSRSNWNWNASCRFECAGQHAAIVRRPVFFIVFSSSFARDDADFHVLHKNLQVSV